MSTQPYQIKAVKTGCFRGKHINPITFRNSLYMCFQLEQTVIACGMQNKTNSLKKKVAAFREIDIEPASY